MAIDVCSTVISMNDAHGEGTLMDQVFKRELSTEERVLCLKES